MATGPVKKETQIIAIYGKGGIGKWFTLASLSYMMAQQGKKALLIGCDPKSDTISLLFGGRSCPTIIETSSTKKLAGEVVAIGDVCFTRDGVYAKELGGPEVGRGCGGRGIIHGFELLEKLGSHDLQSLYVANNVCSVVDYFRKLGAMLVWPASLSHEILLNLFKGMKSAAPWCWSRRRSRICVGLAPRWP